MSIAIGALGKFSSVAAILFDVFNKRCLVLRPYLNFHLEAHTAPFVMIKIYSIYASCVITVLHATIIMQLYVQKHTPHIHAID